MAGPGGVEAAPFGCFLPFTKLTMRSKSIGRR